MSSPATSSSSRGGRAETRLTDLARAGFVDLTAARSDADELAERLGEAIEKFRHTFNVEEDQPLAA
jgi:hypothetical protein